MKNYTKTLFDFFGYDTSDTILCECCSVVAVDVMHLWPKGKYPEIKNDIFNLMAGCRRCHDTLSNKKEMLLQKHLEFMLHHQPKKTLALLNELTTEHTLFNQIHEALIKINEK